MIVKLLTEHHLEFLSLTGGCASTSETTLLKMPHCWKSHALAHIWDTIYRDNPKSAFAILSFPPTGYLPAMLITRNLIF